jgi:hypothetical protein
MNNELKRMSKKSTLGLISGTIQVYFLKGPLRAMKDFSQNIQCPGRDPN